MVSLPDTPRPQGREGKEWHSSQSENPNFPVAPPETTSSVSSSNKAAKSGHDSAHNWRTWRSTWQLSRPWEAAQKQTSWCSPWAHGFTGPGHAKAKNHSCSYLSGQTRKCNFIEGEEADTPINNLTEFKRNAVKLVLHRFQFIPWRWLVSAPNPTKKKVMARNIDRQVVWNQLKIVEPKFIYCDHFCIFLHSTSRASI